MTSFQRIASASLLGLLTLGTGCVRPAASKPAPAVATSPAPVASAAAAAAPPTYSCGSSKNLSFGPSIPPDMSQVFSQTDANCFAWRQFIALNWPASDLDGGSPAAGFGPPGDLTPVQWQTYMSTALLFPPDGGKPPPWGTQPQASADCLAEANVSAEQAKRLLPLMQSAKFTEQFSGASRDQAFPFSGPAWLGAQNGTNVWYDVRVSQPEYDYVVDAGLYNANNQVALVDGGAGSPLILPAGSFSTNVGSIELKSAWMEAPDAQDPRWNSYKLAPAVVADPETQKCRTTTVALVGLHIIHKTAGQPGFVWTTFEHVNNAPDNGADAGTTRWNFYDAQCQPQRVQLAAHCSADGGATEVTVGCEPNVPPPYYIGGGCPDPRPIQVTRMTPIDATAQSVNQVMQQQIGQAYPGSVWGNYMLVNTLWSTNPSPDPTRPKQVPLSFSGAAPSANTPIANTTLETYLQVSGPTPGKQQVSNCIVCHQNATIAGNSNWASDFSFIFGLASAPPSATKMKSTESLKKARPTDTRPRMRNILQ